jgi:hypothetical protein
LLVLLCAAFFLALALVCGQGDFLPEVVDAQPISGIEIGEQEPLVVTFDQAMRRVETTLTFTPKLSGTAEVNLALVDRYEPTFEQRLWSILFTESYCHVHHQF